MAQMITIRVDSKLHQAVKDYAHDQKTSMQRLIAKLLAELVAKNNS